MKFNNMMLAAGFLGLAACGGGDTDVNLVNPGDDQSVNLALASAGGSASSAGVINGVLYPADAAPFMTATNDASVTVTLAQTSAVTSVVFNAVLLLPSATVYPNSQLTYEESSDGSSNSWNPLACTFSGSGFSRTCTYDTSHNTRYIRVTFDDGDIGSHHLFRLYEIQVFAKPAS